MGAELLFLLFFPLFVKCKAFAKMASFILPPPPPRASPNSSAFVKVTLVKFSNI